MHPVYDPRPVAPCRGPFVWSGCEGDRDFYRCKACGQTVAGMFGARMPDVHFRELTQGEANQRGER